MHTVDRFRDCYIQIRTAFHAHRMTEAGPKRKETMSLALMAALFTRRVHSSERAPKLSLLQLRRIELNAIKYRPGEVGLS